MDLQEARRRHTANPRRPGDPLKPRERLFVDAYTGPARYNGAEAARMAGYSDKSGGAAVAAANLKKRANVAAAIEAATADKRAALAAQGATAAELALALVAARRAAAGGQSGRTSGPVREVVARAWGLSPDECWLCGHGRNIQRAHIVARRHGGPASASNFLLLCGNCHEWQEDFTEQFVTVAGLPALMAWAASAGFLADLKSAWAAEA